MEWDQIKFVPRPIAEGDHKLIVVFYCKTSDSIFTKDAYSEVIRFVDSLVHKNYRWPNMCLRTNDLYDHNDQFGCSNQSYVNASGQFETSMRDTVIKFTDEQLWGMVDNTMRKRLYSVEF